MFDEALIKALGNRLYDVAVAASTCPGGGGPLEWGGAEEEAIAREVIRQMQWTWLSAKWANPETMSWDVEVREDGEPDLKLAPEGWDPDA